MAAKKTSAKATKKKSSAGKKAKQTLLAEYSPQFEKVRNILLTGLGAMGVIVDILFKTGNGEIGNNTQHSNMPLMAAFQTEPEVQGKYAEVFATFPEAEYSFPAYCFGSNTTDDVRNMEALMQRFKPPLVVLSLENVFSSAKFSDIEHLVFNVLDIAKQLQRDADIPFCLASPTLQLPNDYFQWADSIFDCGVLGNPKRFEIEDIAGEVK